MAGKTRKPGTMITVTLPSNVEAERSVLGSMLIDEGASAIGTASLTEDSFSGVDNRNVLIFRAMKTLVTSNQPIEPQSVINQLNNAKVLDDAGGPEYIRELIDGVINPDDIDHYVTLVQDQAVLRKFLTKIADVQDRYQHGQVADIGDFIGVATRELEDIANERNVSGFRSASTITKAVLTQIERESGYANKGLTGVDTGYKRLNKYTHGWQKGDLIILAARPSVGKTAFALNLAVKAVENHPNMAAAFFSSEMDSSKVMKRVLASQALVGSEKLDTGDLGPEDKEKVRAAAEVMETRQLFFDDTPNIKLGDLVTKTHKLKAAHPNLGLIVIDYLNIIAVEEYRDNRALQVGVVTKTLKQLARSLKIPVICLAQINRAAESNESHVPMLSNLKESGSIEQDADVVMLMYRSDYYKQSGQGEVKKAYGYTNSQFSQELNAQVEAEKKAGKDKNDTSVVHINIAKNRNGKVGTLVLMFSKSYSRFDNPTLDFEKQEAEKSGTVLDLDED